jgi:hypothetical protein
MTRPTPKLTLWLGLVAAAVIVLVLPAAAQASTNVVPNPGFEQGGCGASTPVLCGWSGGGFVSQDTTNPHTGSASMHVDCGASGCYPDPYSGWASVGASSGAGFCAAIGPGVHPASLWYRDVVGDQVSLDAAFFSGVGCAGYVGSDSLADSPSGAGWQQLSGAVEAPSGTQSVRFGLSVGAYCSDSCSLSANFDDLNVDDAAITAPLITSFTPTSGWFGMSVSIYGFNFANATSVTFNGTEAQFSIQPDESISAEVPPGATTGPISVTTANGTGWSSSSFTLVPPPTIASFTPSSGPIGTSVDIHGASFTGATSVQFNGTAAVYTVDSDSEIHATVPSSARSGPISVTNGSGTGDSASSFTVPVPTISSFTPASGPVGTIVDIRGSNLTAVTWMEFNSGPYAQFTIDSDTEIHATVPCGAWPGPIVLGTAGGSGLSSAPFTVTAPAPSISSFTPTSGPVRTTVDIRGSDLCGAIPKFNGTLADWWTLGSSSEVRTSVRDGSTTGPISLTTPGGTATSSTVFTVTGPPTISSFTPTSGPPGTSVDIQGTNFTAATSLTFNGTADASFVVNSSTDITAHVPAGATTGPISIATPAGTATSSGSFTITPPPPTVSSFTPTSGPVGTSVSIAGSGFTAASSVAFNGPAASYTVNSPTSITATVPSGATSGPIAVTTPYGTGTSADSFTVVLPPTITSFTPGSGSAGTNVTITGSNLTGVTKVKLGRTVAAYTINSPTSITATVPSIAPGYYKWSVTNPAGTGTSSGVFHVT